LPTCHSERSMDVADSMRAQRMITGEDPAEAAAQFRADVTEDGAPDVTDGVELPRWAVGIGPSREQQDYVGERGKVGEA
jgi:hypothetical protein